MDNAARDDISGFFKREYRQAEIERAKGPGGWVMRKGQAWGQKLAAWENENPMTWRFPMAMLGTVIVLPVLLVATLFVFPLVTLGLSAAATAVAVRTNGQLKKNTRAALDRDIGNGKLARRYQVEKLQPAIAALETRKTALQSAGIAMAEFAAAAGVDQQAETTMQPQPLPVRLAL